MKNYILLAALVVLSNNLVSMEAENTRGIITEREQVRTKLDYSLLRTIEVNSLVEEIAFSPSGESIVVGFNNNRAVVFSITTGKELQSFNGHTGIVCSVAFSPDGKTVLTGSWDKTARLWDVDTGKELKQFNGHTDVVRSVAFSPDGKTVLTGSWDKTARLWDVETGKELKQFNGHEDLVSSVAFSPDGTTVLTGSWDGTVRLWDINTEEQMEKFFVDEGFPTTASFSPDGSTVLALSFVTAHLWDIRTEKEIEFFPKGLLVGSVAFSSNGQFILIGLFDGTVLFLDRNTGDELQRLTPGPKMVLSMTSSPQGILAFGAHDAPISIWKLNS